MSNVFEWKIMKFFVIVVEKAGEWNKIIQLFVMVEGL